MNVWKSSELRTEYIYYNWAFGKTAFERLLSVISWISKYV